MATTITDDHETIEADHRATIDAMHAAFGEDGPEVAAKAQHLYRTTLAPWRDCVDRAVAAYLRTRIGPG